VAVVTLGCPKNRVDSEVMLGSLARRGFLPVGDPADADVVIVNTCAFVEDARRESIEAVLEAARLKRGGRRRVLAVAGCMAQRYGEELRREMPEIDLLIGLDDLERVHDLLDRDPSRPFPPFPAARMLARAEAPRWRSGPSHSAYLKISEGCDRRCSFCAIPAIRGSFRSRPMKDVMEEARRLTGEGVKEINLVAQDTSGYGRDLYGKPRLAGLLEGLSRLDGLEWIRLHYLDPARVTGDLIRAMTGTPRVCPYFDIPLQHVSGRILRSMKRGGHRASFEDMIGAVRKASSDAALRTSFIVGYPGETDEEFEELLDFVRQVRFDHAGFFAYSREEGTEAARLPDVPGPDARIERLNRANLLQESVAPEAHERWVGTSRRMVVEGVTDGRVWGRTSGQAPEVDGVTWLEGPRGVPRGTWLDAAVTGVLGQDLIARRAETR
jgi:ribosomal protein S12 methylthiotransferase